MVEARESVPGVGIVRYRHFGLVCSCGQGQMSGPLTDEQIAVCERDSVAGLYELSEKERMEMGRFYTEHKKLGHEPTPAVLGPLPE